MKMPATIQVGVKVPVLLHDEIKEHATALSVSKSEVVLTALARYLDSAADVPLGIRMTKVEKRLAKLEALVKSSN